MFYKNMENFVDELREQMRRDYGCLWINFTYKSSETGAGAQLDEWLEANKPSSIQSVEGVGRIRFVRRNEDEES